MESENKMARKQKFEKVHTSDPEDNLQIITNGTEQTDGIDQRCASNNT